MASSILVRATDLDDLLKGYPSSIVALPHVWGGLEGLPNWVHFDISDADKEEMVFLGSTWLTQFSFAFVSESPTFIRYRLRVDPSWVSTSGIAGDQLTDDMERYIEDTYDGTIVNASTTAILAEIPTDPPPPSREDIEADFNDKFHDTFNRARWVLPPSEVDIIVAAGGDRTYTRAESDALWIDKLTE